MYQPFFPDPLFGWLFVVALAAPLIAASWIDYRKMTVPKWLSVGTAAGGVVLSAVRCAWLGANGQVGWFITPPGVLAGLADGLLFSLSGLAVGFVVFLGLWVLGVCGGGDVKLVAAVGAWLGPRFIIGAMVFSLPVVILFVLVTYLGAIAGVNLRPKGPAFQPNTTRSRPLRRLLTFSLPLTVSTVALLLLGFGPEIGLYTPPAPPPQPVAAAP